MTKTEKYYLWPKYGERKLQLLVNFLLENKPGKKGRKKALEDIERHFSQHVEFSRIRGTTDYYFDVAFTTDYNSLESSVLSVLHETQFIAEFRGCWVECGFLVNNSKEYFQEVNEEYEKANFNS